MQQANTVNISSNKRLKIRFIWPITLIFVFWHSPNKLVRQTKYDHIVLCLNWNCARFGVHIFIFLYIILAFHETLLPKTEITMYFLSPNANLKYRLMNNDYIYQWSNQSSSASIQATILAHCTVDLVGMNRRLSYGTRRGSRLPQRFNILL